MGTPQVVHHGFDREVNAYDRGRPSYPSAAVQYLKESFKLGPESLVLELGAGTGKFTQLLTATQSRVIAVEPVPEMRKKFHELFPNIEIKEGRAEAIPSSPQTFDAVLAAQAFHWFDGKAALKEIHRVLKPGGYLGLVWNARDESTSWVADLTQIIDFHEGETPRYKCGDWKQAFTKENGFTSLTRKEFYHYHHCTPEMIVDRVKSISFIAKLLLKDQIEVLEKVRHLISNHPETRGKKEILFPYRAEIYWAKTV